MSYPDFYIVGAPKCGTTALASYLEQSDSIYFHRKEIHYFGTDLKFNRPRVNLKTYEKKTQVLSNKGMVGDASVYYLYSESAAREIFEANPNAKIIICLRHPVDFMCSLHAQLLSNADEVERDFVAALNLEKSRIKGQNVPWYTHPVHALFYRKMSHFSSQVIRYKNIFGAEQVKIVLLDQLAKETSSVVKGVYQFLNIEAPNSLRLDVVNPSSDVRFRWLKIVHKTLFSADGKIREFLPSMIMRPIDFVFFRLMSKKATKHKISRDVYQSLCEEFDDEILCLEQEIGLSLESWKSSSNLKSDV